MDNSKILICCLTKILLQLYIWFPTYGSRRFLEHAFRPSSFVVVYCILLLFLKVISKIKLKLAPCVIHIL